MIVYFVSGRLHMVGVGYGSCIVYDIMNDSSGT